MVTIRAANVAGIMMTVYIAMVVSGMLIGTGMAAMMMTSRSTGMAVMITTGTTMMATVMVTLSIANMIADSCTSGYSAGNCDWFTNCCRTCCSTAICIRNNYTIRTGC